VIAGVRVEQTPFRAALAAIGQQRADHARGRVLPALESLFLHGRRHMARGLPEQQISDLDSVALRAYGGRAPRFVDEQSTVVRGREAPVEDLLCLAADGVGKPRHRTGKVAVCPGTRQCRRWHPPLEHLRGVSTHDRAGGHVSGDHGSGCDHGAVPNRHAVEDDRVRTNPHVVADPDPLTGERLSVHLGIGIAARVIEGQQGGVGSDADSVAQLDLPADHGIGIHGAVPAGAQRAGEVSASSDVTIAAKVELLVLHRGELRNEAGLLDRVPRMLVELAQQLTLPCALRLVGSRPE
jgi:hypothetical protein